MRSCLIVGSLTWYSVSRSHLLTGEQMVSVVAVHACEANVPPREHVLHAEHARSCPLLPQALVSYSIGPQARHTLHDWQGPAWKDPAAQGRQAVHCVSAVAEQGLVCLLLAGHVEHSRHWRSDVAVGAAYSHVAPAQGAETGRQTRSDVGVALTTSYWEPAKHLGVRGAHTRSESAVGETFSYSSAPQTVSSAQTRSVNLLHLILMYLLASHRDAHFLHTVSNVA